MRFARLRKQIADYRSQVQSIPHPIALVRIVYNIAFWTFLLPFVTSLDYRIGFVIFTIVIFFRIIANFYANNIMRQTPEDFERFPFRMSV